MAYPYTNAGAPARSAFQGPVLGRARSVYGSDPSYQYNAAADQAQNAAYKYAIESLGKQQGEELGGTPGFLAASSMGSSPGYLARLRAQTLRGGASNLATQFSGIGAETARSKRDFKGSLLMEKYKKQLAKQGGGGLGGALKRIAGGAVGFALGGPAGAATGAGVDIPGLPGKKASTTQPWWDTY